ncbi:MAG: HAMP domain-containing protein [Gammaproteobacteria bacterium]|jgi:two-component system phosphate regulon sensor histidine kinase PhoR|nr:HAMP domain-containing protein [Gammaproteobacteria bacterium]MBT3869424.1 HAMP domain-containing protein [Gammaproteobacteria bacterium]MBT4380252.1 HAMP domain-containing protein [Gammaproteobacteria bacterium]MBT4618429.1 HAMP domain-containing protein [Gammaproteobacteria bacterium]MBT5197717.1 HAMP domain-containing protein [Gammaproteobacteria bacterium]
MLGSRFLWQVWGVLGITLIISTLVFGFFVVDEVERDAFDRIENSLHEQALALSPLMTTLLEENRLLTPEEINRLVPGIIARITLADSSGRVMIDNQRDPSSMDNHRYRPEIVGSQGAPYGVATRYSQTLNLTMVYLAIKLNEQPAKTGYLRLAVPLTSIDEQLSNLQNRIFASAVTVGFLFLVIGYLLASRVTNPIEKMTTVARDISRGQFHLRLPTGRIDEIGQLAVVINDLALGAEERIAGLTRHRNQLAAVLAGLNEGVIAFDVNQKVLHVNHAALTILSLKETQLVDWNFSEVPIGQEFKQSVSTCISEHTNVASTVIVGERTLECAYLWLDAGFGEDPGGILVLEDVTERLHLEKVRSDFVANASHELKTPISAIRGLSETIIDDPNISGENLGRFVERIRQQSIRLELIVKDLLHLSRFDSSNKESNLARIRLSELITALLQTNVENARDAGVMLDLDIQDESAQVLGETEALDQLLTNLVDNAIKYTGEGGKVTVHLKSVGQMASIEVEDSGIGISPEETARIFERFYRVDRARSRDVGGTGLGLAIVKHIAQAHSGTVSVHSQLGKGTTFTVQIPLA